MYFGAVFAYLVTVNLPNLTTQDFHIGVNVKTGFLVHSGVVCDILVFPSHFQIRMLREKIRICHLWVFEVGLHCYRSKIIKSRHH
jgi:hypothetical protein